MKIFSRFKDYYDYVEHQYGGGDPLCVYTRDYVVPDKMFNGTRVEDTVTHNVFNLWLPNWRRLEGNKLANFRGLCVAGRFFVLRQDCERDPVYGTEKPLNHWHITREEFHNYVPGEKRRSILALAKAVNAPVFMFGGRYSEREVYGRVPQLGPMALGSFMTAEQVYQEIAMFISNELRPAENPDPPRNDVAKAESHGFDKRISFRHRK